MSSFGKDFLLTEIALTILGNKFYDIHGEFEDELINLYSDSGKNNENKISKEPNLQQCLGILDFTNDTIKLNNDNNSEDSNDDKLHIHNEDNNNDSIIIDNENNDNIKNKSHEENFEFLKLLEENMNNQLIDKTLLSDEHISNDMQKTSKNCYNSDDMKKRIQFLICDAQNEYRKMKHDSIKLKDRFLEDNKILINTKSLKNDDVLKKFYIQQKRSKFIFIL